MSIDAKLLLMSYRRTSFCREPVAFRYTCRPNASFSLLMRRRRAGRPLFALRRERRVLNSTKLELPSNFEIENQRSFVEGRILIKSELEQSRFFLVLGIFNKIAKIQAHSHITISRMTIIVCCADTAPKKRKFLKGNLRNKRMNKTKSLRSPSLLDSKSSKSKSKAASPNSTTWNMNEMKFVGEVIREDFVKTLSKDVVYIHQNICAPLVHNGCSNECFDDSPVGVNNHDDNSFASWVNECYDDSFAEANEVHFTRSSYQQMKDCEKNSEGVVTEKTSNMASRTPIPIKDIYSLGIRSKGTKKTCNNGMPSQSKPPRGKKQSTRRRSAEANKAHFERSSHQQLKDCEKISEGVGKEKSSMKYTSYLGIRSKGTKKTCKNGIASQSKPRGKIQIMRRRSPDNIGRKNLIEVRRD